MPKTKPVRPATPPPTPPLTNWWQLMDEAFDRTGDSWDNLRGTQSVSRDLTGKLLPDMEGGELYDWLARPFHRTPGLKTIEPNNFMITTKERLYYPTLNATTEQYQVDHIIHKIKITTS